MMNLISKNISIFRGYVKTKRMGAIIFVGVFLILVGTFYLYQVPVETIWYSLFLCFLYAITLSALDYRGYKKKAMSLIETKEMKYIGSSHLLEGGEYLDDLYQEIIRIFERDKSRLLSEAEVKYADMLNYYTMWVHQIKTPISAIKLIIQAREDVDKELLIEIFKIEQYVEMVLQYLRMEDMSKDLRIESHSVEKLVRQAVRKYATLFIYNKVSIEIADMNDTILTDEKWFVFVLEQILSNGIKYNQPGGKIKIYIHPTKDSQLVIEDTGIGIKEEDIKRVFERGFTGLNGRLDKCSTGIGLYLSQIICKKLSHHIYMESTIGVGTKVMIDFKMDYLEVE